MKTSLFTALIMFAVFISGNHFCFAQTSSDATNLKTQTLAKKQSKIKSRVEKIGVGGKITVIKLNDKKFFGTVTAIDDLGFQIKEVDLKQNIEFRYSELEKVTSGDGEKNLFSGKRVNPKKGWLYGLAIVGGLITILVIAASDKDF